MDNFSREKTIAQLCREAIYPPPTEDDTKVVKTAYAITNKPIKDLTLGDIRFGLGQKIFLELLVPMALEGLEKDIIVEGTFYEGDLLVNTLRIDKSFWDQNEKDKLRLISIVSKQKEALLHGGLDAEEMTEICLHLREKFGIQLRC